MKIPDLQRLLAPLRRRIALLASRGFVLLDYEGEGLRRLQVGLLAGETRDQVEHIEPYGFTSRPHPGAEVVVVALGGQRDHCLVLQAADRRYRLRTLEKGEVALYTDEGSSIILRRGGVIAIKAQGGLELEGDLHVSGEITATGDVADGAGSLQAFRDIYNLHSHQEHGDGGGVTGPPLSQA